MTPTMMTVEDVMTPDPMTIQPTASVEEAATLMRDKGVGDVLVTDDGKMVGIVTDRDLVVRGLATGCGLHTPVGTLCTDHVVTIDHNSDVHQAVELMRKKAIRRLPVVEKGKPVGIVSIGDLAENLDPDSALAEISMADPTV